VILHKNAAVTYVSLILSNVMNPFLMAYGLCAKRRKLAALGLLGQIFVYATAAMKSVLLSPLLLAVLYYSLKRNRGAWVPKLAILCAGTFFLLTSLVIGAQPGLLFNVATATMVRSFALPGLFVAQYQYFFEHFPHTYLGHVHGISLVLRNPYHMALGQEIGNFFTGVSSDQNIGDANANFFAFDGIAGFGLAGIPVMGVLCAVMFLALDSCTRKYPIRFSASALTVCIISLANNSLFSAFLGSGFMLWMLLFIFMPQRLLSNVSAGGAVPDPI
jgi:hypothetical protein